MILSSHCDYVSNNSIQANWNISLSIQFLDSEWLPAQFTSSWTATQVQSAFLQTIPNYWGIEIKYGSPVIFRRSEYQAISWSSTKWVQSTSLSFSWSNCIDLPIYSTIQDPVWWTWNNSFMDYELFRDTTLVEIWISWFIILMYSGYIAINSFKYAISKN
jgi:hypothetical protein